MVQYPEKKKNGRENVNAKKIKRQRASIRCAILKRKRNREREFDVIQDRSGSRKREEARGNRIIIGDI